MAAHTVPPPRIEQVAHRLDARRISRSRYRGRCPAHQDRSPSLDITAGRDGRVLLLCRAGCATGDVLHAAGLRWSDLYPGPPPSPAEQAAHERERQRRDAARRQVRVHHHDGCDRMRSLEKFVDNLAPRLMVMPDGPEADRLTALYHDTLDEIRRLESILIRMERCWL